ncbi:Lipopolysaccharide assembly protein B [Gammaproteobacteria bacterium]
MWEFLLLPVAAMSGWMAARRHYEKRSTPRSCSAGYFQGLNYLLNEQPDKAIDIFTRMAEINGRTVETQLTLGNLFRRQGEISRAICLHQDIIIRSDLDREQRIQAILELGRDYMRAGLFDRAENLFLELINLDAHTDIALRSLVDIYQQEKDWEKAIAFLQRLGSSIEYSVQREISHYYCELAESSAEKGDYSQTLILLNQALNTDPHCVRASLLENRIAAQIGDYHTAIAALHRVEHQDPEFIGEIIEPLREVYKALGTHKEFENYLSELLKRHDNDFLIIANAELIRTASGELAAIQFLADYLSRLPSIRGIKRLLELDLSHYEGKTREHLTLINNLVENLLSNRPLYCCSHCGFTGKFLHWQCPSCKLWSMVRPVCQISYDHL